MQRQLDAAATAALTHWASQKRKILIGDNESLPSVMGKIRDERVAAGEGDAVRRQHHAEIYRGGDARFVAVIVRTLHEFPRITLTSYWCLREEPGHVPISEQCAAIGLTKALYWEHLRCAEAAVDSGLQLLAAFAPQPRA